MCQCLHLWSDSRRVKQQAANTAVRLVTSKFGRHGPRTQSEDLKRWYLTVKVVPTNTIEELKANAESEVTVIYSRNVVGTATKDAIQEIHAEGLCQVNVPSPLTETPAGAFGECNQVLTVVIPESVTVIGTLPLHIAIPWQASLSLSQWRLLRSAPLQIAFLWNPLSHWRSLGNLPFKVVVIVVLWKVSQSLSQWWPLGTMPLQNASLCKTSLSLSLWGRMGSVPLIVSCKLYIYN